MPTRTLLELRTEVLQRANMENADNFLTATEVDRYLNQSIRDWRDMLVANRGQEFFTASSTLALTASGNYALPADFYQLLSITYPDGGNLVALRPYTMGEASTVANVKGSAPLRYRLSAGQITILPLTATDYVLTLLYVPYLTALVADADTVEVFNGWDEWFVCDAAMKALEKENTDTSQLFMRREKAETRILSQAAFGDRGFPETVTDVFDPDLDGGYYRSW